MTCDQTRPIFDAEARALLDFGARSRCDTGFGWLDDDGEVDASRGTQL